MRRTPDIFLPLTLPLYKRGKMGYNCVCNSQQKLLLWRPTLRSRGWGGGAPLPALHLIVPYGYSLPFFGLDCKINCKDAKNCHIWNECAGFLKSGIFYACKRRRKRAREERIKKPLCTKHRGSLLFQSLSSLIRLKKRRTNLFQTIVLKALKSFRLQTVDSALPAL